jgi:N-acetyl-alpha-D-glucosaminyl L-malate synthase BshA
MRIAVVCYPTFGGSGVVATELAMGLARRGHDVHVVSYQTPFRLEDRPDSLYFHQVDVTEYPLFRHQPYALNLTNRLIELVLEHGVEVIHSHYAIPHAQAAWNAQQVLAGMGKSVKLACTLHGTDITLVGRAPGFEHVTRFAIEQQDLLTAPSAWLGKQTEEHFGISAGRIHTIPNFIDLERFVPDDAAPLRKKYAPNGEIVLAHASNFRPVKRVEDVVRAFAVVRAERPAVLILAGEGPDLPKAEKLARELGVRDGVKLLGNHDRIEKVMQAADFLLQPSNSESFGLTALEALACGVPVIGYRAGGLPEVVIDGVCGQLCDIGSDACLGTIMLDLLKQPEKLAAMRQAARQQATRFAAENIITLYDTALKNI